MTLKQFKRIVNSMDSKYDDKEIMFGVSQLDGIEYWEYGLEFKKMDISNTLRGYVYIEFKEC